MKLDWKDIKKEAPTRNDFYLCRLEEGDILQCEWFENRFVPCLGAKLVSPISAWTEFPE